MAKKNEYFESVFSLRRDMYDLSMAACYCTGYLMHNNEWNFQSYVDLKPEYYDGIQFDKYPEHL